VLHVFLLGIVKYLFKDFMLKIPNNKLVEVEARFLNCLLSRTFHFLPNNETITKRYVDFIISIRYLSYKLVKMNARWANKSKIHILLHIPDFIRRFGPSSLFATENFEIYKGILRNASIHSNCLSPGRDIDPTTSDYVQASPLVQDIFSNNERIQKSLGFHARSLKDPPLTPVLNNHKVEERHRKPVTDHLKQNYPKNIIRQISHVTIFTKGKISQGNFVLEQYQPNQSASIGCVESMWEIIPLSVFYAEIN
ncbi:hypothetical protein VP01_7948g1, partial [Puccinia sorghi]